MYRSNIYPKMILLVSFFVLAVSSVFAQQTMELKLQLMGPNEWGVYVRPNGTLPTTNATTTIGGTQITVVMPLNYAWNSLTNVNGIWSSSGGIVNGPAENPGKTYVSFAFVNEVPAIPYEAGEETLLFTFKGTGVCPDSLYLIDNATDPYNQLPNSLGTNPGNEYQVFDGPQVRLYDYLGTYSPSAWSCDDCDGDGILNGLEDTDGDGVYFTNEDANGNNVLDPGEDLNGNGILNFSIVLDEDDNGNGILDPGEDLDGDLYLDPDVSQICNPCDPYHTESASLELIDSLNVVCFGDLDTACFRVNIDGHWPPYTVNWSDGVDTFTNTLLYDGDIICYVPSTSVSLSLVSIIDSFNCVLDTALGTPIDIEVHGPISFTDQPDNVVECFGNGTTFCVATQNLGDGITYKKWQVNTGSGWVDIQDGGVYDNTDSLCVTLTDVAGKHNYQYRAKIFTSVCDTVYSAAALLQVEGPLTISSQPVDYTNCATETAFFTSIPVNSGAVGTMIYQWEVSADGITWTDITGATTGATHTTFNTTTLNLSNITILRDGHYYRLKVSTGECAFVYSNPARLNVEGAITVTNHPDDISNCAGSEVYFIADFANAGATYPASAAQTQTSYIWQISTNGGVTWSNLTTASGVYAGITGINNGGTGTDSLTITNVIGLDGYMYRIAYNSATCSVPVYSNAATLSVSGNATFSNDPDDITVCSGSDTTFSATASIPQGTFGFAWEFSDDNGVTWDTIDFVTQAALFSHTQTGLIGSGTDVLTVTNVAGMYGRRFRARADATDCNSVYSNYAILSVQGPLSVTDQPDDITECSGNATTFCATIANPGVVGSTIVRWQISLNNGATWVDLPAGAGAIYNGGGSVNSASGVTCLSISNVAGLHNALYRVRYSTSTCVTQFSNAARLTVEGPITVTAHPVDVDLCSGDPASFTSTANVGTAGTFGYQWQVTTDNGTNWTDIDGTIDGGVYSNFNTTTLNVSNSTGLYSRCYRLAFSTGECNRVFSNRACLNIDGPLSFTDHPDNIVQCSGEAVLFCATAITGSLEADSLTQIQWTWQENTGGGWADLTDDTLYNGVLTSCLSVAYTSNMDGNSYRAKIWTDNCDTLYSNAATVDVEGPITVTDEPDNVTQCSGSGVTFQSTVAIQNGLLSSLVYQWEESADNGVTWTMLVDGGVFSGTATTTLSVSNVANKYGYRYRMRYRTPTCDSKWTNYAVLTVEGPIAVTNHPDHVTECSGNPTNFSIQTSNTGQGSITYQWQVCVSGDSIAGPWINLPASSIYNGTTTANFSIANVAGLNGYFYRALIQTSTCSSVASYAAVLQVEGPISFTDHPDNITQCSGEGVTFSAATAIAVGNVGTMIYQWQWSSDCINYADIVAPGANNFSGWNTPTLTVGNVVGIDGRCFRLTVRTAECNRVNSFPATLTVEGPLTITVNPSDFTNCSDKEAYFFANVVDPSGYEVFSQWQLSADDGATWQNITQLTDTINGNIINFGGYDGDSLLISPIIGLDSFLFRNIFWSETCNRDTTTDAMLTVEGPITFTDQPDDVQLCSGNDAYFTIAIANSTGQGTVTYQWQRWTVGGWVDLTNSAPFEDVFTQTLHITNIAGLYNTKYRCEVSTGSCDSDFSDLANLFVEGPITISTNLADTAFICSNRPYLFNTTVTNPGFGQMTYRWQYSTNSGATWTNFPTNIGNLSTLGVVNPTDPGAMWQGATNQDLNITNTDGLNGWMFRLTITMPNCNDITNDIVLVVRDKCLSGLCDLDNDGVINNLDADDDNDQVTDYWEQWMTDNNTQIATTEFPGTGPWNYTVCGGPVTLACPYISYNRCLTDTDGDGLYDNQEDPDGDNINNGEETDGDVTFDGNPLDPCSPVLGPTCIGINLAIRVNLQGARIGVANADTLMRGTLRDYGTSHEQLIPHVEPYTGLNNSLTATPNYPFKHKGTDGGGDEELTVIGADSVFAKTGPDAIVDWVFVELRSSTALDSVATTRAGLLQRDGDVVDIDGVSPVRFPTASAGTFYVAVRHRNHLGVMSGEALELSPLLQEVDFTDPTYPTNGQYAQVKINNRMYMWAGDLNSNGRTVYQGPGNDILKLFTTVLQNANNSTQIANFISEGYQVADVNLDGRAIYQGPLNDRSILLLNTILTHPANNNLIANFVILQQLP